MIYSVARISNILRKVMKYILIFEPLRCLLLKFCSLFFLHLHVQLGWFSCLLLTLK